EIPEAASAETAREGTSRERRVVMEIKRALVPLRRISYHTQPSTSPKSISMIQQYPRQIN
ncbi:MAG: hypothetical protein LBG78_00410, partial [Azoarcus sp.]|nr:hypothetical protein [Azoarcus sp.]